MKTSTKQTEKVLGITYTVGTKAWTIAKQKVRLFNQLSDEETSRAK